MQNYQRSSRGNEALSNADWGMWIAESFRASLPSKELLCKLFLFGGFNEFISKCFGLFFKACESVSIYAGLIGEQVTINKRLLGFEEMVNDRGDFSRAGCVGTGGGEPRSHSPVMGPQPGVSLSEAQCRHA